MTQRFNEMLADFDVEEYNSKVENLHHGLCTVSYRNPKGEHCSALGFLCVIRLPLRGNVFGLMTNSQILSYVHFETRKAFCFNVSFDFAANVKELSVTLEVHRDVESWFNGDGIHIDATFVELRPELQLAFVENGCVFLQLSEAGFSLKAREVLIFDSQSRFFKGEILDAPKRDLDMKLSKAGMRGTPVIDDITFEIVAVCRTNDRKILKDAATNIQAIAYTIAKSGLRPVAQSQPMRKSIITLDYPSVHQPKSRLSHIRDSAVIPSHMKGLICDRLQQFFVTTADDLASCNDDHLKRLFPEASVQKVIRRWQKSVSNDFELLAPEKDDVNIHVSAHSAHLLSSLINDRKPTATLDCLKDGNYFKSWSKKAKGKVLEAPAYIRALVALPDSSIVVVVTAEGHFIALQGQNWSAEKWRTSVTMEGEMDIVYAVYDSAEDSFYLTNQRQDGDGSIYRVRRAKLAKASKNNDENGVPLKFLVESSKSEGRHFWGMAIDSGSRLLFACDNGGAHNDISIWRLPYERIDNDNNKVHYGVEKIASLQADYVPAFCSFFIAPHQQVAKFVNSSELSDGENVIVLAVCDWRTSQIELFAGSVDAVEVELTHIATVAKRDGSNPSRAGCVSRPSEIVFDPSGNLLVADQLNYRVSVFRLGDRSRPMQNVWLSRPTGSFVERFALVRHPKTGRAALCIPTNFKSLVYFE